VIDRILKYPIKVTVDPFRAYALSFITALLFYSFGWSYLYPSLSISLILFLLGSVLAHLFVRTQWRKSVTVNGLKQVPTVRVLTIITVGIYLLWCADFLYEGGIPLVKILFKQEYNYLLFGVPSLHVFTVTFSSFYTVYLFHCYMIENNRLILLLYLINLFAAILIYSRAMFFFNLTSSLFLYLFVRPRILIKEIVIAILLLPLLFYFFGTLGTLRVSRIAHDTYNNSHFLNTGGATSYFRESLIPDEFFWTYIYISSPVANLQKNIEGHSNKKVRSKDFLRWFNDEVLPDFISKRINTFYGVKPYDDQRIVGPFNVSTIYSKSYSYLGWVGLTLMMVITLVIPFLYLKAFPTDSPFLLTGLAIMATVYFYMAYDNTIKFTGLSFQLVYPIVLALGHNYCMKYSKQKK
jgi:hypothetical protein